MSDFKHPIKITLNQIKLCSPCESGWKKLLAAQGKKKADDIAFPMSDILDSNGLDDCIWAMECLPEHNNLWRKYAVWCVRRVEHLLKDEESIKALDVAWRHSDGQATDEELDEARAAARAAADAAADAAEAVARAAEAVARAAGRAAYYAAYYAACAAGRAAAERKVQSDKLRKILNAGQWVGEQK